MRDEFATYIEQFGCEVFLDHEEGEELAAYAKRLPSAGDLLARVVASPDAPQCFSEIADWGPTAGTPPRSASAAVDNQEDRAEQNREDDQHDEHGSPEIAVVSHGLGQVLRRKLHKQSFSGA